jgi:predicted O-linked N-acetylglucosamine transferase (SPINDLY family)
VAKIRLLNVANRAFKKRQFDISEALYSRILEIDPKDPIANYRVALSLKKRGQFSRCINYFKIALENNPINGNYWLAYIGALLSNGETKKGEAVLSLAEKHGVPLEHLKNSYNLLHKIQKTIFSENPELLVEYFDLGQYKHILSSGKRQIINNPMSSKIYGLLGLAFFHLSLKAFAVNYLQRATIIDPKNISLLNNHGIMLLKIGQIKKSIQVLKSAIIQQPDHIDSYNTLNACTKANRTLIDPQKLSRLALTLNPNHAVSNNNFGANLIENGEPLKALRFLKKSSTLNPLFPEAIYNLGIAEYNTINAQHGMKLFKKTLLLTPLKTDGYYNLANCFSRSNKHIQAIKIYQLCLITNPKYYKAQAQSIVQKAKICDWSGWNDTEHLRFLSEINRDSVAPFEMLTFEDNPGRHQKRSEAYTNQKIVTQLPNIHHPYTKPERLTIGYFSSTFREHPVTRLIVRLFELHDKSRFVVNAYSLTSPADDDLCLRIKKGCDGFYDVSTLSDRQIALLARSHNLDIAIDLSGFTEIDRSNIFALRAAPIQINFLGYPGTIGATFMDYIIADTTLIPKQSQHFYSEKIIYLPNCYQPQDSLKDTDHLKLTRKELGLPENAFIFCCFNSSYKIGPNEFNSWATILEAVNGSALWLIKSNAEAQYNLVKEANRRNIGSDRLIFSNRVQYLDYLARLRLADLCLDTFNYNAGATASDALRAGLPLLTKTGNGYPARMASSLLKVIGLKDLITQTKREYEIRAIELAKNPKKIQKIRSSLKRNKSISPLFNSSMFTMNIEKAYQLTFHNYFNSDRKKNILIT